MPVNLMAPNNNGLARLMGALGAGDAIESNAQANAQYQMNRADAMQADLDRKITEAVLERDKRKSQQTLGQSFIDTGMDPAMAALAQNANIAGLATSLNDVQGYDLRSRAEAALRGANLAPGNAELAALDGKPLIHTAIDGNMQIGNRYAAAPTVATTPIADAMIRANDALVGQRNASAHLSDVKAAGGGFAPRTGGGGQIQAAPAAGGGMQYTDTGNNAVARARAILDDAIASGGVVNGYSPQSVRRDMADDGQATIDTVINPGEMRWITGDGVKDIPMGAMPAPAAPAPAAAPPPQVLQRLREGVNTTFGNGQVWTLRNGAPVQVR